MDGSKWYDQIRCRIRHVRKMSLILYKPCAMEATSTTAATTSSDEQNNSKEEELRVRIRREKKRRMQRQTQETRKKTIENREQLRRNHLSSSVLNSFFAIELIVHSSTHVHTFGIVALRNIVANVRETKEMPSMSSSLPLSSHVDGTRIECK